MAVKTAAGSARQARARAVLQAAELRTGVKAAHPSVECDAVTYRDHASPPRLAVVPTPAVEPIEPTPAIEPIVAGLGAKPGLPVQASLRKLVPGGSFAPGSVCRVRGSTSLLFALLAEASQAGSWLALVGEPSAGLLAAAEEGLALERLALVPQPGADAPQVIAALLDGMDAVVVGPEANLSPADRRRLTARARERGTVIIATAEWEGAGLCLAATGGAWQGAEAGAGWLQRHCLNVRRTGRGVAGKPGDFEVEVPLNYRSVGDGVEGAALLGVGRSAAPAADSPAPATLIPRPALRLAS